MVRCIRCILLCVLKLKQETTKFSSTRLIRSLGRLYQHTALDALESLTWVLVWVGLWIESSGGKGNQTALSSDELTWRYSLSSHRIPDIKQAKTRISEVFLEPTLNDAVDMQSECLIALSGLFARLFDLHKRAELFLIGFLLRKQPEGQPGADKALAAYTVRYFDSYVTALDEFIHGKLPPLSVF